MSTVNDEYLLPKDVAAIIHRPLSTLSTWRSNGKGPAWQYTGGRCVAYRRSDVDAWLEAERQRSAERRAS